MKISKELESKYKDEVIENLSSLSPSEVLAKYLESYGLDKSLSKSWLYKLSRYLAYCIDGGLMVGHFSLVDIIENYTNNQYSNSLLRVIFFLLHLTPEKGEIDTVFVDKKNINFDFGMIFERIKKMYLGSHLFNEKVMKVEIFPAFLLLN
jgi:hypothetical protein